MLLRVGRESKKATLICYLMKYGIHTSGVKLHISAFVIYSHFLIWGVYSIESLPSLFINKIKYWNCRDWHSSSFSRSHNFSVPCTAGGTVAKKYMSIQIIGFSVTLIILIKHCRTGLPSPASINNRPAVSIAHLYGNNLLSVSGSSPSLYKSPKR